MAEDDERFYVNLGPLTNANPGSTPGTVTIISDDPDPFVNIDSVMVTEGDPGDDVMATFTVSVSGPSGRPMSVTATTIDGTAVAGDDYQSTTSSFSWPLQGNGVITSSNSQQFTVPIVEDLIPEETEAFYAQLVGAVNVIPGLLVGTGTIEDDDPEVDLDTYLINHNQMNGELPDEDEETLGAYLPVNNDDDDYDAQNLPDWTQQGAIVGESDLLPIILRQASKNVPGATYNLEIPSHVRVWQNDDRTVEFTQSNPFPIDANSDTTLYVEGVSEGSGLIKIHWTEPGVATRLDLDRIKVSTFTWNGPLNVPGYSVYKYTATGGHSSQGTWVTPSWGTIKFQENQGLGGTDRADALWDSGPIVGKAVYQARDGYVWDLEVNVVEISISTAPGTNSVTIPVGSPSQNLFQFGTAEIKANGTNTDAIVARIGIDRIRGPIVPFGGTPRGEKFMRLGLSQQGTMLRKRGLYDDSTPAQQQISSLEDGHVHWDVRNGVTVPYIAIDGDHLLDVQADELIIVDYQFETSDNPILLGTRDFVLGNDTVDRLSIIVDFWDYLIVESKDSRVLEDDVRSIRASFSWSTDMSGTIDESSGVFLATGAKTTSPNTAFIEETLGNRLQDAESNFKELFATETWTTENQQ